MPSRTAPSKVGLVLTTVGLVGWLVIALAVIEGTGNAVVLWLLVMVGPAWATAFCLASDVEDFRADPTRSRDEWLRVLPWTFPLAPLVLPNLVLLVQFFRDARADHGRTFLGSG